MDQVFGIQYLDSHCKPNNGRAYYLVVGCRNLRNWLQLWRSSSSTSSWRHTRNLQTWNVVVITHCGVDIFVGVVWNVFVGIVFGKMFGNDALWSVVTEMVWRVPVSWSAFVDLRKVFLVDISCTRILSHFLRDILCSILPVKVWTSFTGVGNWLRNVLGCFNFEPKRFWEILEIVFPAKIKCVFDRLQRIAFVNGNVETKRIVVTSDVVGWNVASDFFVDASIDVIFEIETVLGSGRDFLQINKLGN